MDGSLHSPRSGSVYISASRPNSSYNLVCNRCVSAPKFTHFEDFLEHSKSRHGPSSQRSTLTIIQENSDDPKITAKSSVSRLSTRSGLSATFTNSTTSMASMCSNDFDLRTLKRACLTDLVQLLNKCFCIWHRPSRSCMPRSERFHAYQLLLLKLREQLPFATFRDARNIVRQLIRNYAKQSKEAREKTSKWQLALKNDTQKPHNDNDDDDEDEDEDDEDAGFHSLRRQDPMRSRTVLDQLSFLSGADTKDVDDLVPDKLCSFCHLGFQNTETLWTHMVSAHLPPRRSRQTRSASHQTLADASNATAESSSLGRRRQRSRSNTRQFSASDTDYLTDISMIDGQQKPLRRSRRRKKAVWRNLRYNVMTSQSPVEKRVRRKPTEMLIGNKAGGDEKAPSTFYLGEYSDSFLEEFIELYHQHDCLWMQQSKHYRNRKMRAAAYDALVKKYCEARNVPAVRLTKIKQMIRRMRRYYDALNRPNANPHRRHIWQRLDFLDEVKPDVTRHGVAPSSTHIFTDYDCSMCLQHFKRAKNFAAHMVKSHPPTGCPPCKENFVNADELKRHLLSVHRQEPECPLCRESQQDWKASAHLSKHFFEHKCPTCTQIYHDIANFRRHKSQCKYRSRFKCHQCNQKFASTLDFRRHAKSSHHDERPFKCEDCEISFKFMAPLTKHRQLHKRLRHYY